MILKSIKDNEPGENAVCNTNTVTGSSSNDTEQEREENNE